QELQARTQGGVAGDEACDRRLAPDDAPSGIEPEGVVAILDEGRHAFADRRAQSAPRRGEQRPRFLALGVFGKLEGEPAKTSDCMTLAHDFVSAGDAAEELAAVTQAPVQGGVALVDEALS